MSRLTDGELDRLLSPTLLHPLDLAGLTASHLAVLQDWHRAKQAEAAEQAACLAVGLRALREWIDPADGSLMPALERLRDRCDRHLIDVRGCDIGRVPYVPRRLLAERLLATCPELFS